MKYVLKFSGENSIVQEEKALFLDRDGIVNIDKKYVYKSEQFEFVPGIFDLCKKAKNQKYILIIVTNQSGIGRGYYSEEDFKDLMIWVNLKFKKNGSELTAAYYCPYFEFSIHEEYRKNSSYRKPQPGMILEAKMDFRLDLSKCVLVGDQLSDMQAGLSAGVGNCYLFGSANKANNCNPGFRVIDSFDQVVL